MILTNNMETAMSYTSSKNEPERASQKNIETTPKQAAQAAQAVQEDQAYMDNMGKNAQQIISRDSGVGHFLNVSG